MSIQQAQLWLKNHTDCIIPAIGFNHQKIIELLESENSSREIALFATADPGLSLALLKKVNINRGPNTAKTPVESVKSAITLLGDKVAHSLLTSVEVAEKRLSNPDQLFLFNQIINRSYHHELQVEKWADENGYQNIESLKSAALLNYVGELLCCVHDYDPYLKYIQAGSITGDEKQHYGFTFAHLTKALCRQLNLPETIINSLTHNKSANQKELLLSFIATLCHQCEQGWYTTQQFETFQQFSDFLQHPIDQVIAKFHQYSVQAANQSIISEAWQPASRLPLIRDKAWAPLVAIKHKLTTKVAIANPPKKAQGTAAQEDINVVTQIKQLLRKTDISQTVILNTAINGLKKDLSMSRVSLLLLSKDNKKLLNRLSIGFNNDSPFPKFQIEVAHSGFFKILLNKPQSLWINDNTFKKYIKIIPPNLIRSIHTKDFICMSLFIGNKPIGIIYADQFNSKQGINEQSFLLFKQIVTLTSKALTYLSKKQ